MEPRRDEVLYREDLGPRPRERLKSSPVTLLDQHQVPSGLVDVALDASSQELAALEVGPVARCDDGELF
jgi:hypothetical protein